MLENEPKRSGSQRACASPRDILGRGRCRTRISSAGSLLWHLPENRIAHYVRSCNAVFLMRNMSQ